MVVVEEADSGPACSGRTIVIRRPPATTFSTRSVLLSNSAGVESRFLISMVVSDSPAGARALGRLEPVIL